MVSIKGIATSLSITNIFIIILLTVICIVVRNILCIKFRFTIISFDGRNVRIVNVYICMYVCMNVCTVCMYTLMRSMYVCMHARLYVCMYVYVSLYLYVYIYVPYVIMNANILTFDVEIFSLPDRSWMPTMVSPMGQAEFPMAVDI